MSRTDTPAIGMIWRLRRVAADLRQQDVAARVGITTTRYSALERGEATPDETDTKLIENVLPPLPELFSSNAVQHQRRKAITTIHRARPEVGK